MVVGRTLLIVISCWIVLALLGGIGEGVYLQHNYYTGDDASGTSGSNAALLTSLADMDVLSGDFWGALGALFTFDFSFFHGGWAIFRWIMFLPLLLVTGYQVAISLKPVWM